MPCKVLPSIWLAEFRSKSDFDQFIVENRDQLMLFLDIDDRLTRDRHAFWFKAWCSVCSDVTAMQMSWHNSSIDQGGSVQPAWTEINACQRCGHNSRMRALFDALTSLYALPKDSSIYMAEQVTPSFSVIKSIYQNTVGSEFLGSHHSPGEHTFNEILAKAVRHEDMTRLSFEDESFDAVITQDVFEHIPNFDKAFLECRRILKPDGLMLFTIPFFSGIQKTEICAVVNADGSLTHLYPPEVHGNPVDGGGSLCFQHFGWSILDDLKASGFADVIAHLYWGPWAGHRGGPFFVFSATIKQ